jgi:hypothetical protein
MDGLRYRAIRQLDYNPGRAVTQVCQYHPAGLPGVVALLKIDRQIVRECYARG